MGPLYPDDESCVIAGHFTLTEEQRRFKAMLAAYLRLTPYWDFERPGVLQQHAWLSPPHALHTGCPPEYTHLDIWAAPSDWFEAWAPVLPVWP